MSSPEPTDPATGDFHTPTLPARLKKERIYEFINLTTATYAGEVYEGIRDTVENEDTTEEELQDTGECSFDLIAGLDKYAPISEDARMTLLREMGTMLKSMRGVSASGNLIIPFWNVNFLLVTIEGVFQYTSEQQIKHGPMQEQIMTLKKSNAYFQERLSLFEKANVDMEGRITRLKEQERKLMESCRRLESRSQALRIGYRQVEGAMQEDVRPDTKSPEVGHKK